MDKRKEILNNLSNMVSKLETKDVKGTTDLKEAFTDLLQITTQLLHTMRYADTAYKDGKYVIWGLRNTNWKKQEYEIVFLIAIVKEFNCGSRDIEASDVSWTPNIDVAALYDSFEEAEEDRTFAREIMHTDYEYMFRYDFVNTNTYEDMTQHLACVICGNRDKPEYCVEHPKHCDNPYTRYGRPTPNPHPCGKKKAWETERVLYDKTIIAHKGKGVVENIKVAKSTGEQKTPYGLGAWINPDLCSKE